MNAYFDLDKGPGRRAFRMRHVGGVLVAAALGATLAVPVLLGGRDILSTMLRFPTSGYIALFAVIAASWLFRAVKLHMLLHRLDVPAGFPQALGISLAMDFAFMATPGGVGGYAAGVYYLRRAGASASGATTLTAADQGLDLMFFALALPLAGMVLYGSNVPETWSILASATAGLALTLVLAALLVRRKWHRTWLSLTNAVSTRWPALRRHEQAAHEFCANLRVQFRVLAAGGPLFLGCVFALTALQWLTRYGVLWLALALLGHHVSFALTLSLQALVTHAAQWTGVPAGGGGAELGLSAALVSRVPASDLATALLLWRLATLYVGLIAGAIAIALLARRRDPQATVATPVLAMPVEECAREGALPG
ncbi:lysylphosphatidylglycerol synthase transmembrane domain-containing protein [Dokdonella soli]|uniref:Flippase-like domain-containing protein n=1 Tax=Dokdonella soli TaxID=529810 RepID=A0ABP3TJJ0_9GAMM